MDESVRNQLGSAFLASQQNNDFTLFNNLLSQYNVSQSDLLQNFPNINQAGISEFVGRGVRFPSPPPQYQSNLIQSLRNSSPDSFENRGFKTYANDLPPTASASVGKTQKSYLFNPSLATKQSMQSAAKILTNDQVGQSIYDLYQQGKKLPEIEQILAGSGVNSSQFSDSLDDRLGQAIYESYNQGFNVPTTKQGAMEKMGATDTQFNSALDKRLAQAIEESIGQGFDVNLTRQGAIDKLGVSNADFDRALAIYSPGYKPVSSQATSNGSAKTLAASTVSGIGSNDRQSDSASTSGGYVPPTGQTKAEQLASSGVTYGNLLGGMLPGGMVAGTLGNAYIDSRLNDAALNGGYTGMYTGDAAFGGRPNNTATAGGNGPLSGDAWGAVDAALADALGNYL